MEIDKKYKIALMIPNLLGGGAERVACLLSDYFVKKGHQVYFLLRDANEVVKYHYSGTLKTVPMTYLGVASSEVTKAYAYLKDDADKIRKVKCELGIEISISFMQDCNLLNLMSKDKDKIILTNHCVVSKRDDIIKKISWDRYVLQKLYQCSDSVVCVSEAVRKDWIENYVSSYKKIEVIYNPVHIENDYVYNEKILLDKSKKYIVSVARFDSVKRVWHTIRVFHDIVRNDKDVHLLLLGDGELKNTMLEMVRKLKIENNVHFLGFVSNVKDYMRISRLMIVSSKSEACSCAIQEAISYGLPVVSNDCPGGNRELLGVEVNALLKEDTYLVGECGIITPYLKLELEEQLSELTKEERIMSDAVQRLLYDDELYRQFSNNCIKKSEEYQLNRIGEEWEQLFGKVINNHWNRKFPLALIRLYSMICSKKSRNNNVDNNAEKYYSYYQVLEKWMRIRDAGKSLTDFFVVNKYKKIIIYGMGYMARHLVVELDNKEIKIICGIDNRINTCYFSFPVLSNNDDIPEADIIVVTVTYEYEAIKSKLEKKTSNKIISLQEVIEESLKIV